MRVLICGGRDYSDIAEMYRILGVLPISVVISGHAKGADQMAEMYANERGLAVEIYPADWEKHGKRAGPIRNIQMLDEGKPDMVVAFPGGKGTAHMVKIAKERDIFVAKVLE